MSNSEANEVLYAYIAVALHVVSLVLIRDDNGIQKPVYYISKSLHEIEVKYLPLEKDILVVVHATRKLPHYFQAHTVVILTRLSLKFVLQTADYTGRIAKWNTILGAFDVKYMPRTSIKGQVLVDLVVEFAEPTVEVAAEERSIDEKSVGAVSIPGSPYWKEKSLKLGFSVTNNEAEYEALLQGMVMVQKMGGKSVEMFSDLRLVVGQVEGELEARDLRIHTRHFLSRGSASSSAGDLSRIILMEHLERASEVAKGTVRIHQVGVGPSWMDPIVRFLKDDVLSKERSEAEKIQRNASRFWLSEDHKLYRRSYSGPYLLCVHPQVAELLLEELHEGICGSHTGGRSLSYQAVTQGYWWLGMQKEALEYVKKCD
ncbi:uncharacterized protein LOC136069965 [Quercus suber]|uniref:uncharacterized protein LOC136069965 n=1 Tax=Quercus suber TaxID=58331 RepID=UPI0032DF16AD